MTATHRHRYGCQIFQFAAFRWCITHAEELIAADPSAAMLRDVPVEPFRQFLPLEEPPPGHLRLVEVTIDPAYAAGTDLATPIMIAPIIHMDERLGSVIIDGWHRTYRALTDGVEELPSLILTEATSLAAMMPLWR